MYKANMPLHRKQHPNQSISNSPWSLLYAPKIQYQGHIFELFQKSSPGENYSLELFLPTLSTQKLTEIMQQTFCLLCLYKMPYVCNKLRAFDIFPLSPFFNITLPFSARASRNIIPSHSFRELHKKMSWIKPTVQHQQIILFHTGWLSRF